MNNSVRRPLHSVDAPPTATTTVVQYVTSPHVVLLVIFESLYVGGLMLLGYSAGSAISIALSILAGVMLLVALPAVLRASPAALKRVKKAIHQATSSADEDKDETDEHP